MIDARLRVLQLVAQHGTVTAAAQALNYTPSAVSHQLRQLADEIGVQLLVPAGRGVRLTEQARTLLRHAEILFAQEERAYADLSADTTSGTFTLCGFSTAANYLLPDAAMGMRRKFPQLDIRVVETEPTRCTSLLLAGEADIALLTVTTDTPTRTDRRFDHRWLLDDPLELLVPNDHPLAHRSRVTLADAAEESWIVGRQDGAYYPLTVAACLAAGFSPDIRHYSEEWATGLALVAHGFGVSLVPRMVSINSDWGVTRVPLSGDTRPSRRIISLTRAGARQRPLIATAMELIEARAAVLVGRSGSHADRDDAAQVGPGRTYLT